jgi:nucleoside-diphosphate-sugar epimerase
MRRARKVFVTGGAGYVGSVLVPKLLAVGHRVKVLDLYIYGDDVLDSVKDNSNLAQVKGDIRDRELLEREIAGGKSINYDAFLDLVDVSAKAGIRNFIYASSSSVYGVKEEAEVTEDLSLEPLTDYSKYKAMCEEALVAAATRDFIVTVIRPSTVCGYSPRLRLDLTVNILTNHAINKGEIMVFGGEQMRPNLHIEDMADLYVYLLELPKEKIHKKIWNAGYENYRVREIAAMVSKVIDQSIPIKTVPTDDIRSYRVSSRKIAEDIGFVAKHSIEEAVRDLKNSFAAGRVPDPLTNPRYYNIKTMQAINLS